MAYVQKGDNPISRMKGIKLSQKDLNDPKSASSVSKSPSLGVEGQGGVDYENTQYNNVEGQGGVDYEAADYKPRAKRKPGVSRKASPLNDTKVNNAKHTHKKKVAKKKAEYTLHGKPLTEAQTGFDPKQLISDQSLAADKKGRIKYDAEQRKKDQAKPKPKPKPKTKNPRAQAVLAAREAKKPQQKSNKVSLKDRKKKVLAERAKKNK